MRPNRTRITIAAAILALVAGFAMTPGLAASAATPTPVMTPFTLPTNAPVPSQSFTAAADVRDPSVTRDSYTVTAPKPKPKVAAAVTTATTQTAPAVTSSQPDTPAPTTVAPQAANWSTDPGSAEAYALSQLPNYGWGQDQFGCLVQLWTRESGWSVSADNTSSGAYGIPQALPGSKMASAGPDWQTNPHTQITWGLGYIQGSYGSPCQAWAHETSAGWY